MDLNTTLSGTKKFERHAKGHQKASSMQLNVKSPLPAMSQAVISRAAALAFALDLRQLSFTQHKRGMQHFVNAIFPAGQHTPVSDRIDPASLMPSTKCVTSSLKKLVVDNRKEYKGFLLDDMYQTGGAITTDGVTLKVQDTQYQDLTLHCIELKNPFFGTKEPVVNKKVVTLLLKEKGELGDASSLRAMLGHHLQRHYDKDIDWLTKRFTMATDCAAVMERVALSSVSFRVAEMDEKWMGCLAHQINTAMKSCLASLTENQDLQRIFADLQNVKNIVRIFKQSNWNPSLPNGFHLIQECETRFSTTFTVVERFIKSPEKVKVIIHQKNSGAAKAAFAELLVEHDHSSGSMRFPALQAIIDAFDILVETQTRVQGANTPKIHLALPLFHHCMDQLDRIADGGPIWRNQEVGRVPPCRFTRKLCRSLMEWLEAKVRVHHLWSVGCFLHPFMREFQFVTTLRSAGSTEIQQKTCCGL